MTARVGRPVIIRSERVSRHDAFRLGFQRDRDRVLWSVALKRLSNKTQLFPGATDDHLRRRLTHSIEVMQLASTIATSFGLERDLREAGALVHDVGHTPFGHAGEYAFDRILLSSRLSVRIPDSAPTYYRAVS